MAQMTGFGQRSGAAMFQAMSDMPSRAIAGKRLDVAARGIDAAGAADHHHAHVRVLAERLDDGGDLAAAAVGDDVQRRPVEDEPADLAPGIHLVAQAVEVAQDGAAHGRIVLHFAPPVPMRID